MRMLPALREASCVGSFARAPKSMFAAALLLGCSGADVDQKSGVASDRAKWNVAGLQVSQQTTEDWQALSYQPIESSPHGWIESKEEETKLSNKVISIIRSYENLTGLVTLVALQQGGIDCGGSVGSDDTRCRDVPNIIKPIEIGSDRPQRILCTSPIPSSCLESDATVRLSSSRASPDEEECSIKKESACLYALGFDRSGRIWIICDALKSEPPLEAERVRQRSEHCISLLAKLPFISGAAI